ncbi:hypothetical protein AB0L53_24960 [Nonomuraea sp. NPDC052129]
MMKNIAARRSATSLPAQAPSPMPTAAATAVICAERSAGTETITPQVAAR